MAPPPSPLFSLPTELLTLIVSSLPHRSDLIALAQTCQKLQPFAEAQLFKKIFIRDGPSVTRLAQILEQPPSRVLAVEHLEATPGTYGWRGIERMPELAGRMVRLRGLKVESPLVNTGRRHVWWTEGCMGEYMKLFEQGTWGCLTSCKLAGQRF
ncbi:hypothetical protein P171DRAFT_179047 [Karstenula rhodostoma CBS 690.94]|uniref:F-box domain-containing protein n=1 Tax=Karstenula rhodostoma CBS 690.94 TaxID=1392251 RepID=A0A9P4P6X0_9PLEO|nr:hypothetical protein P171DRAFT_179047 [Karstenula rhodostoma CBS 690.94]